MDGDTLGGICVGLMVGVPLLIFGGGLGTYFIERHNFRKKKLPLLEATVGPRICENLKGIEKAIKERDYSTAKGLLQERKAIMDGGFADNLDRIWFKDYGSPQIKEAISKGNKLEEHLYVLETAGI